MLAAYLTAHPWRLYASVNTKYCTQLSPYRVRPLHGELEEPNNLNTPVAMATVAIHPQNQTWEHFNNSECKVTETAMVWGSC